MDGGVRVNGFDAWLWVEDGDGGIGERTDNCNLMCAVQTYIQNEGTLKCFELVGCLLNGNPYGLFSLYYV